MDDQTWLNIREKLRSLADQRHNAFFLSIKAYESGDKVLAKKLSNLGKDLSRKLEEARRTAAEEIFKCHNKDEGVRPEIDLHRLNLYEAIFFLQERIMANNDEHLDVIVGRGKHSENGPKIKPRVQQFAEKEGIPYILNFRGNQGVIRLLLKKRHLCKNA